MSGVVAILAEAQRWRRIAERMDWKGIHHPDHRLGGNYSRRGLYAFRRALALEALTVPGVRR